MSGILRHIWGKSRAADQVWAEVCGLAPAKAGRRPFLVLRAFIDDSYKAGGTFALGGYIASAEAWAAFSKEWEETLPYSGLRNKKGNFYFKMAEMNATPERMQRVSAFYRIIENHVLASLSCAIDIAALERAKKRICVQNARIDWSNISNPYMFTFHSLLDMFHANRQLMKDFIPLSEKVDFYFDDQTEKKFILSAWDEYLQHRPDEYKQLFGAAPGFKNDDDFLPLQAADLWAWWVRKWEEEGSRDKLKKLDFGIWQHKRKPFPMIHITYTEDKLANDLKKMIRNAAGENVLVCDIKSRS